MTTGDPALHVLVGSNGAGKSTMFRLVIEPETGLPFVNADDIAAARWPDDAEARSYDAAAIAEAQRRELITERRSFAFETVFSHPSKVAFLRDARRAGYVITLHAVLVPEELSVARVENRVAQGVGHAVPEQKIRERYHRLWDHVADAVSSVQTAFAYDNSSIDRPFQLVATFRGGRIVGSAAWPKWTPAPLTNFG